MKLDLDRFSEMSRRSLRIDSRYILQMKISLAGYHASSGGKETTCRNHPICQRRPVWPLIRRGCWGVGRRTVSINALGIMIKPDPLNSLPGSSGNISMSKSCAMSA